MSTQATVKRINGIIWPAESTKAEVKLWDARDGYVSYTVSLTSITRSSILGRYDIDDEHLPYAATVAAQYITVI